MNGIEMIEAERERQVEVEGWTAKHDDTHRSGNLLWAAACYVQEAASAADTGCGDCPVPGFAPEEWPWDAAWWKPCDDQRRNLAKAGALIAAEIDRLNRIAGDV